MAGSPYVFISYRRSDAQQAALGLYFRLRLSFGSSATFMDVGAITPGEKWPDRLQRAVHCANVMVAVIGPGWLTAADAYGRRRLDQPEDWVRRELELAIAHGKTIVPLLVGGLRELPPREALPLSLQPLLEQQALELRDGSWDDDVKRLVATLAKHHGFVETDTSVMLPQPEVIEPALTGDELDAELEKLPLWEPVESYIPRDYPHSRHELRRPFRFDSFKKAIAFINAMVEPVNKMQHHPRLENQWRTVIVYLSTWDIGQKISRLDIELAHKIDALYEQQKQRQVRSAAPLRGEDTPG